MRTKVAQPHSSSKKMRKGIVAGVAGIALLAGGGASFATWSDTYKASATVKTGTLSLDRVSKTAPQWTSDGTQVQNMKDFRLTPGTAVTYTDRIVLTAQGAEITVDLAPELGKFAEMDGVRYSVKVREPNVSDNTIFEWNDKGDSTAAHTTVAAGAPRTLELSVTITLEEGAGNETQGQTLKFTDVGLKVTQTTTGESGATPHA